MSLTSDTTDRTCKTRLYIYLAAGRLKLAPAATQRNREDRGPNGSEGYQENAKAYQTLLAPIGGGILLMRVRIRFFLAVQSKGLVCRVRNAPTYSSTMALSICSVMAPNTNACSHDVNQDAAFTRKTGTCRLVAWPAALLFLLLFNIEKNWKERVCVGIHPSRHIFSAPRISRCRN